MKKVLLVDDEAYILDLLTRMIPWEFYGFEVAGKAESAAEAMQIFYNIHPDVIITDICMEHISGIEFITRIRMQDPAVKILILSAYDKFEYAQKALKLNVDGYLLKPVNREELIHTLLELQREMDQGESYQVQLDELQSSLNYFQRKYYEEQLLKLYRGAAEALPDELQDADYWCILSVLAIVRNEIVFFQQDIEKNKEVISYSLFVGDGLLAVFLRAKQKEKLEECLQQVERTYIREGTLFCGRSSVSRGNQAALCVESKRALNRLFYTPQFYFAKYMERDKKNMERIPVNESREQFLIWLTARRADECRTFLEKWFADCAAVQEERETVLETVKQYLLWMKETARPERAPEYEKLIERCDRVYQLQEAKEIAEAGLRLTEETEGAGGKSRLLIERANAYIRKNCCRETFSIEELAEHLHISKSYLSKGYKEETGESVWNFVMRVRITKAKELLVSTDATNFAIAKAIGYTSEYHFSRAFSKLVGVSPSVYKKMYLK